MAKAKKAAAANFGTGFHEFKEGGNSKSKARFAVNFATGVVVRDHGDPDGNHTVYGNGGGHLIQADGDLIAALVGGEAEEE